MTLDKWIDTINSVVSDFCKSIDEEYESRMGCDFCAVLNENTIEWSLIYAEKAGQSFYENFVSRYPVAKELSFFTVSILHEIGHFETEWEMIDDTEIRNRELTNEQYYDLFNERIATDWAGEWIENNYSAARCIDKKFTEILNKFYKEVLD